MRRIAVSLVLISVFGLWPAGNSFAQDNNLEKMPTFGEETYQPTSQALPSVALEYGVSTVSEADKGVPAADDDL